MNEEERIRERKRWRESYYKHRDKILAKRKLNREKSRIREQEYREQNREKLKKYRRERYWRDPERMRKIAREYARAHPPKKPQTPAQKAAAREAERRYRNRHRERLKAEENERLARDPEYRLIRLLRTRVAAAVRSQYSVKACKTMELIGCGMHKLFAYLEQQFQPGMDWHNYGKTGWHIDHIIPCAAFDLSPPEQQKACFHYTNLRPMWARENTARGSRIDGELPLIYRHKKTPRPSVDTPPMA